jgi:hypothetical protein
MEDRITDVSEDWRETDHQRADPRMRLSKSLPFIPPSLSSSNPSLPSANTAAFFFATISVPSRAKTALERSAAKGKNLARKGNQWPKMRRGLSTVAGMT